MIAPSLGRPRFLTLEEAIEFHRVSIEAFGGADGLRDSGALESALAMPKQGFGGERVHAFPFEMASAYAFHIAKNHPFVDGNKRTALMCCGAFLRMNGWDLVSEGEQAADAIISLVTGSIDKAGFARWLDEHCRARVSYELRDFFAVASMAEVAERAELFHVSAGNTPQQFVAAVEDAAMAMPIVADLAAHVQVLDADGKHESAARRDLGRDLKTFLALYRLAEDMGYEW